VVAEAVTAHRPDALLVSLGLIDLGFFTSAAQTEPYVRAFVAGARAAAPGIRMVLLPVLPNIRAQEDAAFAAEVEDFNLLLAKAVGEMHLPASPVLLAPPPTGYDTDRDTYDGTHLSAAGEHRIAGAFADVLFEEWGVGAPYPPCPA
jgi:lysophospholipase L1-like esterase